MKIFYIIFALFVLFTCSYSQEEKKLDLDTRQLFAIDPSSVNLITQHSKFVSILLHNKEYPKEIDDTLTSAAIDIATQRVSKGLPTVLFATVDTSEGPQIMNELQVKFEDTNYLFGIFSNQKLILFNGNFNKNEITAFIQNNIDRSIKNITATNQVQEFLEKKEQKRILISSTNSTFISELEEKINNEDWFWKNGVQDVRLIEDFSLLDQFKEFNEVKSPFILFIKDNQFEMEEKMHFYEGRLDELDEINEFVQIEAINLVETLTADNYVNVFGGPIQNQINLFLDSEKDNTQIISEFTKAALYNKQEELKYQRLVFVIQYFSSETQDFMGLYDVRGVDQLPFIGISKLDFSQFGITKYILDTNTTELNEKGISEFCEAARTKTISPHYRSEKDEGDIEVNGLLKIVGTNFKEKIIREKMSYLVLFVDSKDPAASKEYFEFLKEFKRKIPAIQYSSLLKLSTFDLNKNEVEYLNINSAPKLVIYPQFYKQSPQAYKGQLKLEFFTKFLNQWVRDLSVSEPIALGGPSAPPSVEKIDL